MLNEELLKEFVRGSGKTEKLQSERGINMWIKTSRNQLLNIGTLTETAVDDGFLYLVGESERKSYSYKLKNDYVFNPVFDPIRLIKRWLECEDGEVLDIEDWIEEDKK